MRIALLANGFIDWSGGRDFLLSCANALNSKINIEPLEIHLFVPQYGEVPEIEKEYIRIWLNDIGKRNIRIVGFGSHRELVYMLKQFNIEVIVPSLPPLGKNSPFPWVGYIYDFQHKYYPEIFTPSDCQSRDKYFAKILTDAKAVIVNSQAVKNDIFKYYSDTECRVFCLPFAADTSTICLEQNEDVFKKYGIPQYYFLISNSFCIHKAHGTAFEALALLKKKTKSAISIVCTGSTHNPRFPGYLDELKDKMKKSGIQDHVFVLGHIPKADQIQIMRNAVAVLQPTMFEGGAGGGSVRAAVALGVPAIVSDIPVNQEITDDTVVFFQAGSAKDMSEKMLHVMASGMADRPDSSVLKQKNRLYTEAIGNKLFEAISYVTELTRQSF